jgi:hypothetical protein
MSQCCSLSLAGDCELKDGILRYSCAVATLMYRVWSPPELKLIVPDSLLSNGKMLFDQFNANQINTSNWVAFEAEVVSCKIGRK